MKLTSLSFLNKILKVIVLLKKNLKQFLNRKISKRVVVLEKKII